jgi:hypothetical protein
VSRGGGGGEGRFGATNSKVILEDRSAGGCEGQKGLL